MQGPSSYSNVVANTVTIVGPNGGMFVYSPTKAVNNLVETDGLTVAGHDSVGNTTLPGTVQYMQQGGVYFALQITGGSGNVPQIKWLISSGDQTGTYSTLFIVGWTASAGQNGIDLGSAAAFANPPQCFSSPLLARNPTTPASGADTWHTLALSGSWTAVASQIPQYKLMNDNTVMIVGQAVVPAGVTGPGNTVGVVTGPYVPARSQSCPTIDTLAASPFTATAHSLTIRTTSGNVDVFGAATAGNTLTLNVRYPLD